MLQKCHSYYPVSFHMMTACLSSSNFPESFVGLTRFRPWSVIPTYVATFQFGFNQSKVKKKKILPEPKMPISLSGKGNKIIGNVAKTCYRKTPNVRRIRVHFRLLIHNIYGLKIIKSQKTRWFLFTMCTFPTFWLLKRLI
jgi:hypothetical protein